jgi:hypothetical protein
MRIRFVIILLAPVIFICCQKEFEDPNDIAINTTADFKAKINGVQFDADIYGAAIRPDSVISIAGKSNDGQQFVFTVKDSGVHVYTLSMNSTSNFAGYRDANGLAFASNEGYNPGDAGGILAIILLDRVKRTISGTFNFKAFREDDQTQRTITEGIFNNIPY